VSHRRYLYHVTFCRNLKAIARRGLRPGSKRGITDDPSYGVPSMVGKTRKSIFLSSANVVPFWFDSVVSIGQERTRTNASREGWVPVILRVPPPNARVKDEIGTRDAGAIAYLAEEGVPSDVISVFAGDKLGWVSIAKQALVDTDSAVDDDGAALNALESPLVPAWAASVPPDHGGWLPF
jgi:hypothetical protein